MRGSGVLYDDNWSKYFLRDFFSLTANGITYENERII